MLRFHFCDLDRYVAFFDIANIEGIDFGMLGLRVAGDCSTHFDTM